ncbi:hypothetical protein [Prosthecobacter sp.]|uniref:hypothetical protein n=1 Tax=Prosthecobacter sp. TaxID=1965333 RepID=UPI003784E73A
MILPCNVVVASQPASPEDAWILLAFPFFFIGMWLLITFIISRTGWVRFARAYPCPTRPPGTTYVSPYASFSGARYSSVVSGVATEGGLYLRAVLIFSAFHTPFLLPWSSVTRIEHLDGWLIKGWLLHVKDSVGSFQIRFRPAFEGELRRYVPVLMNASASSSFPFIK